MKYESFNITANNLRFRGIYGFESTAPENITELITCVVKNLKGSVSALCCSSGTALNDLRAVCDITYFVIEDVSPASALKEKASLVCEADKKTWSCECGKENEGNFCTHCGKKRPPVVRHCTSCGEKLLPDANFCGNCGKKI